MSKVRRFRITGMDNGYPITPYIVETDYRGNIDIYLQTSYGDSVRYYEELSEEKGERKMDKEKQNYVYYIYFQDKDLEPVYICDWYEDKEGAFINGWSRYRDFAYIFTTYDQAKNVMIKLQANDEWEKYLIGLIAL